MTSPDLSAAAKLCEERAAALLDAIRHHPPVDHACLRGEARELKTAAIAIRVLRPEGLDQLERLQAWLRAKPRGTEDRYRAVEHASANVWGDIALDLMDESGTYYGEAGATLEDALRQALDRFDEQRAASPASEPQATEPPE